VQVYVPISGLKRMKDNHLCGFSRNRNRKKKTEDLKNIIKQEN